ncbi:hypothetical protein LXL04_028500 [Taraxacum kok-saghyz]
MPNRRIPIFLPETSSPPLTIFFTPATSFTDLDSDHLSPPPPPALQRLHSTSTTAAVSPSTGRIGMPISPSTRLPTTVPISPPSRLPILAVSSDFLIQEVKRC